MAMGQAAGTAAALAMASGTAVQALDAAQIVSALMAQGVRGIGGEGLSHHAQAKLA
jgi:hypothetical protein